MPIPSKIANAPELLAGLELYFLAYLELATCRPTSFGDDAPIPWLAVENWALSNGLDEEQRDDLHFHVAAMDGAHLGHKASRRDKGDGKHPGPIPAGHPQDRGPG
jgi:hypothetical protein